MKQQTVEQIKQMINENDTLSSSEKKELLRSLKLLQGYNTDLNKNQELIDIIQDSYTLLKSKDGKNREDKLLENYGLTRDSSKEEIIKKRDLILDELYRQQKRTRYVDKYRRLKRRFNLVKEEFDLILDRYDNRTLAGDLSKKEIRQIKADAMKKYGEFINQLSEFAIETEKTDELEDKKTEVFNYIYEGMSEEEINKAEQEINTHPLKYTSYGSNNHDYLEPIEYYPDTNIRKPRVQGPFETTEHYEAFLAEYFSRYDFSNPKKTTPEQAERFYTDKLSYAESNVQRYFGQVRDALANLRWFYNYSLSETSSIESDIEEYTKSIRKYPSRKEQFESWIKEGKDRLSIHQEFIKDYEEKLDSVNTIMGKLYNEPKLVGDTTLTIELRQEGDKLNAIVSPLVTLVDNENRKKYANYEVTEDGEKETFDEYEFDLNNVTNQDLDSMLTDFVSEILEQGLVDVDMETLKSANVEVVLNDKTYIMPYKDFGLNLVKIMKLGTDAYVPRSTYKDDQEVKNYVDNVGVEQPQVNIEPEVEIPEDNKEETESQDVVDEMISETPAEEVVEEENNASVEEQEEPSSIPFVVEPKVEPIAPAPVEEVEEEQVEEQQVEEQEPEETPVEAETPTEEKDIILPPPLPIGIEDKGVLPEEEAEEEEFQEGNEAEIDESLVEKDTQDEFDYDNLDFDPGDDYHVEHDDEEDYEDEENYNNIREPRISHGLELDDTPLSQEELHGLYKVKAVKKPRHFIKTIAAGVVGGVATIFGLATVNGPVVLGGTALLTGTAGFNWKNIKRAVIKQKLKSIAKRHGAKVFFGTKGRIEMKNPDGSDLTPNQEDWIQYELDRKINNWLDLEQVPEVTLDNLGDAFIFEKDPTAYYVASEKEVKEYKKMKKGETKFESIGPDIDLFGDEENLAQEYDDEPEHEEDIKPVLYGSIDDNVTIKDQADLMHELVRLNPELAREFKQDTTGYWLEIPNPEEIRVPNGFEYNGVAISNIDHTEDEPIEITVFKPIQFEAQPVVENEQPEYDVPQYETQYEPQVEAQVETSDEVIDSIIEKYGNLLDGITEDDIQRIAQLDGKYSYADVEAAANKYNNGRSL